MRDNALPREAWLSALVAATVAAGLAWLGPPGPDLAAHAYGRALFLQDGFALWNNFWYAGRYSFVTYSVLYYPLAAALGIKLLAVTTISAAALAFAVVVGREWGPAARWSSRTFAVVWAGIVLSAAFPFALGVALALLAMWALQAGRPWRFALLAALTLAASPLAFALLALVLAGIAIGRPGAASDTWVPAVVIAAGLLVEIALLRVFPQTGRFPFHAHEFFDVSLFCAAGALLTWRVRALRAFRWVFVVYLAACTVAFAFPSELGANIVRLRYAAIPVAVLALSLRRWRPLPVCLVALVLAAYWNLRPLVVNVARAHSDPSAEVGYWRPTIAFLHRNLTPSYRVEVVDTAGHWAALRLPRAGIPLVRGWFRQDDFPQNEVLYDPLGPRAYRAWLRSLGVRYVVLANASLDYSAHAEAAVLRSGRSGLRVVMRSPEQTIYELPNARRVVTGPAPASVEALTQTRVLVTVRRPGRYRLAVRYSPYWQAKAACISRGRDGMIRLEALRAGTHELRFHVATERALAVLLGRAETLCRKA